MQISEDYKDLFKILNKYEVKYLVVGAYAVVYYAEPRFTKDIDIWVKNDEANAKNVFEALKEFGAPLKNISESDFTKDDLIYQIGVAPVRIDILTGLPGLNFETVWKNKKKAKYGEVFVNIIGYDDLIRSKRKADRKQDKLDLEMLTVKRQKGKPK